MSDRISDNVGKKIVEALKMQNQDAETVVSAEDSLINSENDFAPADFESTGLSDFVNAPANDEETHLHDMGFTSAKDFSASESDIDSIFQNNLNQNLKPVFSQQTFDFELPNNVAILNRLIAKLPVGVSKQTGATIISQTMEALGISMQSVIQEAKEVQDSLTNNARECQRTIIDYRKQITELEAKAQQYQRQAVTMNDVINLFNHS